MVWWKIYWSFITDQLSVGKSGGLVETEDEVVLSSEVAHQAPEVGEDLLCRTEVTGVLLTSLTSKVRLQLLRIMFGQVDLIGNEVSFNKVLFKDITEIA